MVAQLAAAELPGCQGEGKPGRRLSYVWAPRRLLASRSQRPRPTGVGPRASVGANLLILLLVLVCSREEWL